MTGPQGMGPLMPTLMAIGGGGPVYTEAFCDTFDRSDGGLGGSWDAQYVNTTWGLNQVSGGPHITISGNTAAQANANPSIAIRYAGVGARNAYGSAKNLLDTTLTTATRNCRVFINAGRYGATTGSYYAVAWGTTALGEGNVSITKFANNVDNVLATRRYSVPVNSIIRIRHDGAGLLIVDVDDEDILYAYDQIESESGVWLRALGVGFAMNSTSGSVFMDQVCFGTWDAIAIPDPYNVGDMFDRDTFSDGVWLASGTGRPDVNSSGFKNAWVMRESGSGTSTTWTASLVHAGALGSDQFIELDMEPDSSVKDCYVVLRSTSTSTGYYARWEASNTQWEIGDWGSGVLALSDATSPGNHRIRFTAIGTQLSLYQWVSDAWVLKVQTTSGTYTAPGTIRIAFNDVFNQGIPRVHNVAAGNYDTQTAPTVTINQSLNQTDPVYGTVMFDIQFSEPVTGFVAADVTISGSAGGTPFKYLTGSRAFYQLAVSNFSSNGTVIADIASGVATGVFSGLSNLASTSDDNTVNWAITGVTKPFTVAWNQSAGPTFPLLGDGVDIVASGTRRVLTLVTTSRTGDPVAANYYSPFSGVYLGTGVFQQLWGFRSMFGYRNDLINFSDGPHSGAGNKDLGVQTPFSDGSQSGLCLLLDSGWTVGQVKKTADFTSAAQRQWLTFDTPISVGSYVLFIISGNSDYVMAQAPELCEPIGTNSNAGARTTQIHVWGSGAMAGLTTWSAFYTGAYGTGLVGMELLPP